MKPNFRNSSVMEFGKTAVGALERPLAGRSQRSDCTVWFTQTRTVSRNDPIIIATATIIPTAMARAAAAMEVRRREAGNAAAARFPSMGKMRFMRGRRSAEAVTSADGANAEKAATTKRTEMYPPTATPLIGGRIAD